MYNWSTNEKELKHSKEKHAVWKLEQTVNFGLAGGTIKEQELRQYWSRINIDPWRRKFLKLLLDG